MTCDLNPLSLAVVRFDADSVIPAQAGIHATIGVLAVGCVKGVLHDR